MALALSIIIRSEKYMLRILFLLLAVIALPLKAATVTDLYNAQVVLPSNDQQADTQARQQGLEQVLIKVSGQRDIAKNSYIKKAMAKPDSYISQYGYAQQQGQRVLNLAFSQSDIQKLLSSARAPIWNQRPNVLVWMVDDAHQDRQIVWDQSSNMALTDMRQMAKERGLPLTLPIGDFDDVTAISASDLWGGFADPITKASQRYHPDAILLVQEQAADNGQIALKWQLFTQNINNLAANTSAPLTGTAIGSDSGAANKMINQVADALAQKYAVQSGTKAAGDFDIAVHNIRSSDDFFSLERLLEQMTTVGSANVVQLKGDEVIFDVNLLGSEDAFRRELMNNRHVQAYQANTQAPTLVDTTTDPNQVDVTATQTAPTLQIAPENTFIWN